MARFEFKLPDIGEGVTEGEIVAWHVEPGQTIVEDEPMVEVMTDKATVTIASPKSGRVAETCGKVGDTVQVHAVLVVLELDDAGRSGTSTKSAPSAAPVVAKAELERHGENGARKRKDENVASAVGDLREDLPGMGLAPKRSATMAPLAGLSAYFNEKPLATPATRKLARDLGLDLRTVRPSGPFGRITSDDVRGAREPGSTGAEPIGESEARRSVDAPPAP